MLISRISLLLLIIFVFKYEITAQILPSYSERSFQASGDSSFGKFISLQASEGVINPDEYIVGPGDNIFISINGIEEKNFNLVINHEGFLYIPRVGAVDLGNKTLFEAKKIIQDKLNKNFKNVDIYIALGEVRKIKVSLVGNVNRQSTLTLNSNSRLLDLLKSSDGLTATSDFRNIKVISKNGESKIYDFLKFLRLGNYTENPYLKDGDVVIIDKVNKIVSITGQIKYPGSYEYKEGETVDKLIDLAGGYLYKAFTDSIEVVSFNGDGITQFSRFFSDKDLRAHPITLHYSDQVIVREFSEYYDEQWVNVNGEVRLPGLFKIVKEKTTLTDIIKEAGGFLKNASLKDAVLYRTNADTTYDPEFERIKMIPRADMTDDEYDYLKAKSRQRTGKVVVDFESLFNNHNTQEDIILKKGDIITVPEKKNYVTLIGQVVKPGNIIYKDGLTVDDYIQLAGGFSWRAIKSDVRVIKVNTGEWIDADDVEQLEPGDTIWVLEDPPGPKFWDVFTTTLSVLGQVAAVIAATVAVIVATR